MALRVGAASPEPGEATYVANQQTRTVRGEDLTSAEPGGRGAGGARARAAGSGDRRGGRVAGLRAEGDQDEDDGLEPLGLHEYDAAH